MRHALAFTRTRRAANTGPDDYGWDYNGVPASSLLQWYPELTIGSFTGQTQAAWTVAGNSNYVVLGGEFPRVNNGAQQGLVRFAVKNIAPNKRAPVKAPGAPAPSADSFKRGHGARGLAVGVRHGQRVADLQRLPVGHCRAGVHQDADSNYWNYPMMGFIDTERHAGQPYTYTVGSPTPRATC